MVNFKKLLETYLRETCSFSSLNIANNFFGGSLKLCLQFLPSQHISDNLKQMGLKKLSVAFMLLSSTDPSMCLTEYNKKIYHKGKIFNKIKKKSNFIGT